MNNAFVLSHVDSETKIPVIFCLALYKRVRGDIQQQLLDADRKAIDELISHYQREGVIHIYITEETELIEVMDKITALFSQPQAAKALLLVFGQNGYVLERFMSRIKGTTNLSLNIPEISKNRSDLTKP